MNAIDQLKKYINESADLSSYAAQDAATVLLQNWEAALELGYQTDLVSDVDRVIDILRGFQQKAIEVLPAVNGGNIGRPETKDRFFKTVFQVEVLSERNSVEGMGIETIARESMDGNCSHVISAISIRELNADEAAHALIEQGSNPSFFSGLGSWENSDDDSDDDSDDASRTCLSGPR